MSVITLDELYKVLKNEDYIDVSRKVKYNDVEIIVTIRRTLRYRTLTSIKVKNCDSLQEHEIEIQDINGIFSYEKIYDDICNIIKYLSIISMWQRWLDDCSEDKIRDAVKNTLGKSYMEK